MLCAGQKLGKQLTVWIVLHQYTDCVASFWITNNFHGGLIVSCPEVDSVVLKTQNADIKNNQTFFFTIILKNTQGSILMRKSPGLITV